MLHDHERKVYHVAAQLGQIYPSEFSKHTSRFLRRTVAALMREAVRALAAGVFRVFSFLTIAIEHLAPLLQNRRVAEKLQMLMRQARFMLSTEAHGSVVPYLKSLYVCLSPRPTAAAWSFCRFCRDPGAMQLLHRYVSADKVCGTAARLLCFLWLKRLLGTLTQRLDPADVRLHEKTVAIRQFVRGSQKATVKNVSVLQAWESVVLFGASASEADDHKESQGFMGLSMPVVAVSGAVIPFYH